MRKCTDCPKIVVAEVGPVENYIVHDAVWAAAGMAEYGGFLCVACLERRLGRPLTAADLPADVPLNWPGMQRDTARLHQLKCEVLPCPS